MLTRKARSALTTLGVVFGVAMVAAIAVTYDSAEAQVKRWIRYWHGAAHVQLRPRFAETLPPDLLRKAARVPGVRVCGPHYNGWVKARQRDRYYSLLLMAVDPAADSDLHGFVSGFEGAFKEAEAMGVRPLLLRDALAAKMEVGVGAEIVVIANGRNFPFRVVGVLPKTSFPPTIPWTCGVTALRAADEVLEPSSGPSAVDVLVADDADTEAVARRLSDLFSDSVIVERPETRTEAFHQNLRLAKLTARIISATTLFVGVFIIFNTMAMTVVERKREIGILRAIGMSRRQVGWMLLFEALLMGIVGTALGVALGLGMAKVATRFVGKGLPSMLVRGAVLAGSAMAGVTATLAAAIVPGVTASRVPPLEATRPHRRPASGRTPLRRLCLGLVLMVGPMVLLYVPFRTTVKAPLLATAGIFCFYLGAALVAPFAVGPISRIALPCLRPVFRVVFFLVRFPIGIAEAVFLTVGGAPSQRIAAGLRSLIAASRRGGGVVAGELARRNLRRASGRTALTACALMVGVSFVIDLSGDARSVVGEFQRTLQVFLGADLFVVPQTPAAASLDPDALRRVKGVETVTGMKLLLVDAVGLPVRHSFFASGKIMFIGIEPDTFTKMIALEFRKGESRGAMEALEGGNRVLISSDLVRLGGPRVGQDLRLKGVGGEAAFRVVGEIRDPRLAVYTDWRDWVDIRGIIGSFVAIGSISDARKHFGGTGFDFALVKLARGVDREAVGKEVRGLAWRTGCNAQWIGQRNEKMIQDAWNAIYNIHIVLFAAIVIAALAVLNTMTMNVVERTQEIGVLRALGTTRGQILEMFLAEAAAIGVIGALLGIALGLLLMHATLTLNQMVMGWATDVVIPYREMVLAGLVGVVVAVGGGIYPAVRASRVKIVEAIQME